MLVSFIVSSIDFRQFQNFLLSESSTVFSSSKSLELTNSRSLYCLKTVWYSSLNVKLRGSRCFLLAGFCSSCLLRRHSLSNHFLLKDILCRLFSVVFIFGHRFAVVLKIVYTASREVITFGTMSSRNSLIVLCMCSVCSVALNFCGDSFSHRNCFGRCSNVSLIIGATGFWLIVLMLIHVIIGLWSE